MSRQIEHLSSSVEEEEEIEELSDEEYNRQGQNYIIIKETKPEEKRTINDDTKEA